MSKPLRGVMGAAGLLAGSVLVAKLFGFLRDALLATNVGVGPEADAYFAAFMVPDMLGYLMAAGAAAVAVTPLYIRRLEKDGPEAAARFASSVVGNVGLVAVVATVVLWIFAEPLLRFQFDRFDESTLAETVRLMRIVLPSQIFFLTGGILRGVLMAHGRFAPQAMATVVYSVMPILGGLLLSGAEGFAWGTLAGAVVGQWAIPVLALRRLPGAVGRIRISPRDPDFREYLWLAFPLMLGLGLTTVDEWYEKWLGGQLAPGAISAMTYARKLMMAPVGVVGQAVGAALLPSLTSLFQRGEEARFDEVLTRALRATLSLGMLAGGALVVLALPIVQLLYQHGRFHAGNAGEVAELLVILAFGVPAWVLQQVAVRGFYARSEMWRAMFLNTIVALSVFPLYLWGSRVAGIGGLAMASAAAITLNALITIVWLRLRSGTPSLVGLMETFARTALITLAASAASLAAVDALARGREVPFSAISHFVTGGGVYLLTALIATLIIGDAALRDTLRRLLAVSGRR